MVKPTRQEVDKAAVFLAVHADCILQPHQIREKMALDTLIVGYQAVRDAHDKCLAKAAGKLRKGKNGT